MAFINNLSNVNETFIIEPEFNTGTSNVVSACTAVYTDTLVSCSGDSIVNLSTGEVTVNQNLNPAVDLGQTLGTPIKRFREVNTLSGNTTYWTATVVNINILSASTIDLGLDTQGNPRLLTADSCVLAQDILAPGTY